MAVQALEWDDAVELAITALSAIILVVALMGWRRTNTARYRWFALAFAAFFLKGVFSALEVLWFTDYGPLNAAELLAEAAALGLLVVGMLRR